MIVAVVPVRVVQVAVDQVVNVIPVGQGLVTAAWTMHMAGLVPGAAVVGCADRRVGVAYGYDVLVDMVAVRMVQMTIVQVIDMVTVLYGRVATAWTVKVVVAGMMRLGACGRGGGHGLNPWGGRGIGRVGDDSVRRIAHHRVRGFFPTSLETNRSATAAIQQSAQLDRRCRRGELFAISAPGASTQGPVSGREPMTGLDLHADLVFAFLSPRPSARFGTWNTCVSEFWKTGVACRHGAAHS